MNIEEIKKSVAFYKDYSSPFDPNNFKLKVLIELAEQVLSVAGKMPAKTNCLTKNTECSEDFCKEGKVYCCNCSENKLIDDCTLATVGMFLSEEELKKRIIMVTYMCPLNFDFCLGDHKIHDDLVKNIAKAIHQAQREKLR